MNGVKYSVNQHPIQILLSWVRAKQIAIPEIQRPFVWSTTQVRDLIDSLYQGYPIGYLIAWQNPNIKLKDGTQSSGKRVLIDGQQRVTALMAAFLGEYVFNKDYKKVKIKIAFHPVEERFEVFNTAIEKDKTWIPDISEFLGNIPNILQLVLSYSANNPDINQDIVFNNLTRLSNIVNNQIGLIDLSSALDIETVTEIFIRINSKGTVLSQADFAMSKIASDEQFGGNMLRKAIDYFCHMAVAPEFYSFIDEKDAEFKNSDYFNKIAWLRNEVDDLYDPKYTDLLRVAFTYKFKRGRLKDLVALISGRNFETREFEERIAEESYEKLREGYFEFVNETNFKRFIMIIESAGFIDSSLIGSQNALNFAYIVFLILRKSNYSPHEIESLTRRWYVMSILTERYTGSPESTFDFDIKRIDESGVQGYLKNIEDAELSDALWDFGLPQKFNTSVFSSPFYRIYLAAQVHNLDKGFLSHEISVGQLIKHKGDVHHVFPKDYLKKHQYTQSQYNQIANYVVIQSEINIAIGNKPPREYMEIVKEQCNTVSSATKYGGIIEAEELRSNLSQHCIPEEIFEYDYTDYSAFLEKRRKLMAEKVKNYYHSL